MRINRNEFLFWKNRKLYLCNNTGVTVWTNTRQANNGRVSLTKQSFYNEHSKQNEHAFCGPQKGIKYINNRNKGALANGLSIKSLKFVFDGRFKIRCKFIDYHWGILCGVFSSSLVVSLTRIIIIIISQPRSQELYPGRPGNKVDNKHPRLHATRPQSLQVNQTLRLSHCRGASISKEAWLIGDKFCKVRYGQSKAQK